MTINNRFPPKAPSTQTHISSACCCRVCAESVRADTTTAQIYGGLVQRSCLRMAGPLSRKAIGCDQQLVCRVVSPPAQHHAGAEHAQHLIGEKTAVIWAVVQFHTGIKKNSYRDRKGWIIICQLRSWEIMRSHEMLCFTLVLLERNSVFITASNSFYRHMKWRHCDSLFCFIIMEPPTPPPHLYRCKGEGSPYDIHHDLL